jgi:CYTH domain-containing protein
MLPLGQESGTVGNMMANDVSPPNMPPRHVPSEKADEIERRFLVTNPPSEYLSLTRSLVRQGYLTPKGATPEIRVRAESDKFELTIKGAGTLSRQETPILLTEAQFNELWPLTLGARIEKQRIRIPQGEVVIELDLYVDSEGLMTAEVEFASQEEAEKFSPPYWFGREVTQDPSFRNRALAR